METIQVDLIKKSKLLSTWKVPGMHPRLLAEHESVPFIFTMQSQTPSKHLDEGSAALHCKSVTQGSPKLTAPWSSAILSFDPIVGIFEAIVEGILDSIVVGIFDSIVVGIFDSTPVGIFDSLVVGIFDLTVVENLDLNVVDILGRTVVGADAANEFELKV